MKQYPKDRTFIISEEREAAIVDLLEQAGAEIALNYLSVGSEEVTRYYANCCLKANLVFINCIPIFIASDNGFAARFKEKNLLIIGDDIKSQIGAAITHSTLAKLFSHRGVKLDRTCQLNIGGNTDFLNMPSQERLLNEPLELEDIHIGPADYVP